MATIAVDAMGGDLAPEAAVRGVAAVSLSSEIQCILVGNEGRIQKLLDGVAYNPELIEVVQAAEVIGAAEDPREALRKKRDSSLAVSVRLAAEGRADAVVSAGNTEAAVLAVERTLPRIGRVARVVLAGVYPRKTEYEGQDDLGLLLDVGAAVRSGAAELLQFALMGSAYARRISKVGSPRVALLNTGNEENRGDEVLVEAHRLMRGHPSINFVGNLEGHELPGGRADVVVCEGLLGNVALKLLEAFAEVVADPTAWAARGSLRRRAGLAMLAGGMERPRQLTDYASYGGAPILGAEKVFIKLHGRSTAHAIGNAVKVAAKTARDGVAGEIRAALERND